MKPRCCCCCTVDLVGDSQPRLGILRQDIASTMVRPGTVQKRPSICRRVLISFILLFAIAFDRASSFSSSVPPPSPVPRRSDPPRKQSIEYMNRIRNARDWRAGGNVFLDIEQAGYIPNVFHYSAIISKCAKDRRPDKAMGFLKRMTNQGVEPNEFVFGAAIDACARTGQYKHAILLLSEMEETYGVKPNLKCFSAAISACEKAAKWEEAVKLLRKMSEKGVDPDVISYNSVISACEKCAEWERALEFLDEMKAEGIRPDVVSYSSTISACEKGGAKYTDVALSLFAEMKAEGIQPDAIAYNSAIAACGKGGADYIDTALSLLAEMKAEGIQPDVYSYSSAISACEKGGAKYTDTALSLFNEMKAEGIQPDDYSYSSAISACEKGGAKYTDTALSLFNEMKEAGVKPDGVTYRAITKACFESSRYFEALKKSREAADLGKRVSGRSTSMCIDMSTENDRAKWDLHDLTEATACMLLSDALLNLVANKDGPEPNFHDIIVVTGKGLNTEGPDGPVLLEKVPAFLNNVAGLEITPVEGNEGRFLITAISLEEWVVSGTYDKFQSLIQDR